MPRIMIDYDHVPGLDEPTELDLSYEEMDPFMVTGMAMSGDEGAVDFIDAKYAAEEAQREADLEAEIGASASAPLA